MFTNQKIRLRPAVLADIENVFTWRNHPTIREHSLHHEILTWDKHKEWFERILASPNHHLLIAEKDKQPVGVLRFDVEHLNAEVSIYLVPGFDGQGLGKTILDCGQAWIKNKAPAVTKLTARILSENTKSIRLFTKSGYKQIYGYFELTL